MSVLREPEAPLDAGPVECSATQLCAALWAWRELQISCKLYYACYGVHISDL